MIKVVTTADGSSSLFDERTAENYHSCHGAMTESKLVFIAHGLLPLLEERKSLRILEVGFGTGLNALLTLSDCAGRCVVSYEAIDILPLDIDIVKQLNYCEHHSLQGHKQVFLNMHKAEWNVSTALRADFTIRKSLVALEDYRPPAARFDLIYFDAFSPNVQPELWQAEIFKRMHTSLSSPGILVTYSARGIVKTALRDAGFKVERLEGPPGKRHVIRAIKCA